MKKIISLMMALVLCLSLCACETTSSSTNTHSTKPEPNNTNNSQKHEKPVLIQGTAETLASGYVSAYTSKIKTAAKNYNKDIASISSVRIGSVSADKGTDSSNKTNMYKITIKGTLYGNDAYGRAIAQYTFTWSVNIDYYTYSSNWMSYKWTGDNIKISK